jgi:hypothetical protein
VQNYIRDRVVVAVSDYLGTAVDIGKVDIHPFNELRLYNLTLKTPAGDKCLEAEVVGAGISIRKLLIDRKIRITYAEIVGLDARLWKETPESPLNIQFIIDAFAPKDKNKPPTQFDLQLRNVVIRRSSFTWDKRWMAKNADDRKIDFNHISLSDIKADIALPKIANNDFNVDLRRLAFKEKSGFSMESLSCMAHVTDHEINLQNLKLRLPNSQLALSDIDLNFDGFSDIVSSLRRDSHELSIDNAAITPADLAAFYPPLAQIQEPYYLSLNVAGNAEKVTLSQLILRNGSKDFAMRLRAAAENVSDKAKSSLHLDALDFNISKVSLYSLLPIFNQNGKIPVERIAVVGDLSALITGSFDMATHNLSLLGKISTDVGESDLNISGTLVDGKNMSLCGKVMAKNANLAAILNNNKLGMAECSVDADVKLVGGNISGVADIDIPYIDYLGSRIDNILVSARKTRNDLDADISVEDELLRLNTNLDLTLNGAHSTWAVKGMIDDFNSHAFGLFDKLGTTDIDADFVADFSGNNITNIVGSCSIDDLNIISSTKGKLSIDDIDIDIEKGDDGRTFYSLFSDFVKIKAETNLQLNDLIAASKSVIANAMPNVTPIAWRATSANYAGKNFSASVSIEPNEEIYSFINAPVRPLLPVKIFASFDGDTDALFADISAPYLQQGKNKLIKAVNFDLDLSKAEGLTGSVAMNVAAKHDRVNVKANLDSESDGVNCLLSMVAEHNPASYGKINLFAMPIKSNLSQATGVAVNVLPSEFSLAGEKWLVSPANIRYVDNVATVDGVKISHATQYIAINGAASHSPMDMMTVDLAGVDLQYVFDLLNINYVNFGGFATGRVTASDLFSSRPILRTERLHVDNFQYNESVIGDAELESHWDVDEKMVAINADIVEGNLSTTGVRGGVYVTRDSLSFDFFTNHSNIECLQPFMSGFTSSMKGRASGHLKMFGTFSDIDLVGRVNADTLSLLVDHTNVVYSCADSVFFSHNKITIPRLKLYDKYGNFAYFSGEVKHRYLHDASFNFELDDARHLLAFDTDSKDNDVWFGRIFANGSAALHGVPGSVSLEGNLSSAPGSTFSFILDEKETAADYSFLTFTDHRKEEKISERELSAEEEIENRFAKQVKVEDNTPTIFNMNLNLSVNPNATISLVMDPKAGDKIVAKGNGGLRMQYDTKSDEFNLYGKYVLDNGNYNFSLQDLILRNFKIKEGSEISFNGDPMQGVLDIAAAYRVNTNITDLDQSFVNDADLNRTNVPVDAILNVTGEISQPEIKFDIDLPTMTPEMERKVRSIISTDEMMNIQVIYLLALNRFYTPEYSGTSQGGEFASVASSTISSQISNIIGSLTDKFTVAPSFKSDRNNFSDLEFDVALSSSLFNNRLLINGNLGYRDKSTSLTTFVGDFDIEYLLNRDGSFRLKAYNHFNDASYYLKSALTTQGLGVIFRKDFNNPFSFLRRKKKKQ